MDRNDTAVKERHQIDEVIEKEGFNLIASDKIALDRSLKDYRIPE